MGVSRMGTNMYSHTHSHTYTTTTTITNGNIKITKIKDHCSLISLLISGLNFPVKRQKD